MKVLKFGAVWCSGCIVMKPRWARVEKENPWLQTEYFDFDEAKEAIEKYEVGKGRLPTFVFLNKEGKEIDRMVGEVKEEVLVKKIKEHKDK